ncbi:hypothetical protein [Xanthomonas medicagonis]|uniref:hypothetical protein n=1 Tax=Xanthomonas medicagonis TaxID=3160841 RepID=UPI0035114787
MAVVLALAVSAPGLVHAQEAQPAPAAGSPAGRMFYVEMPAASNAISNALMGPAIGSSNAVKQLESVMARGETEPLEVVAYGGNERLVLKSVEAALKSFQGKRLPYLTLGVVASADKVEKLRPLAEPLGVRLVVGRPLQ